MHTQFRWLLLPAFLLLTWSCKKGGKTGLLVPKDAGVVIHINSKSLSSKISWEEISQTHWFQKLSGEATDSTAQKMLKDPGHAGIDTEADLVFYMNRQGRGGYLVFGGYIKDAAAFEAFNKEISPGETTTSRDGDINFMTSSSSGVVAWNKARFAYIGDSPLPSMGQAFDESSSPESFRFSQDSLKILGRQALTLKAGDNLDSDQRFVSLIKENHDMHIWTNASGLYTNSMEAGIMSMMKLNALLEGNVSATSLNFEDGRIIIRSKQYYGDALTKLLNDYPAKPLDKDIFNRIPSENIVGVFAFNYPPPGLKEFLKVTGLDGMANGFLGRMGYSIDEFVKANKGDLLLAVSDLEVKDVEKSYEMREGQKPFSYKTKEPVMKFLFATSVNDKPAFEKLIGIADEQLKNFPADKTDEIGYKLDNNWFAASNSTEYMDKFLAGGNYKNNMAEKIGGHPFGLFIDIQKILKAADPIANDSSSKKGLSSSINMWQDIVATGGDYKDKTMHFEVEVNLVNKSVNSLKQLNQYVDTMYMSRQERRNLPMDSFEPGIDPDAE